MADLAEASEGARVTSVWIGEALGIRRASVAQMEKRSDLLLSALNSYVATLSGVFRLTVTFPGQRESKLRG